MTIPSIYRNILNETEGIIVHGVNGQGKMAKGFGLNIRNKFPEVYNDYMDMYISSNYNLIPGQAILTHISNRLKVVSGVTQKYYGNDPKVQYVDYEAIEIIFKRVNTYALQTKLPVIFPLIGSKLGGGDWNEISKIIENCLSSEVSRTLFLLGKTNG